MAVSFAQSAIAVLIDLAQRGELDPWDVQVLDVFDRCLQELALTNQQDLAHSGQAFVYASMLILLKSDSLVNAPIEDIESDFFADDFLELEPIGDMPLPVNLERNLQRRAVAPPPQRRRVTLQELISQLELISETIESQHRAPKRRSPVKQSQAAAMKTISELAHQENLTEISAELDIFLRGNWDEIAQTQDWLDFDALLEFRGDRVGIFWALLFLSSQSKVELSQEEFYRDLKLRPLFDHIPSGALTDEVLDNLENNSELENNRENTLNNQPTLKKTSLSKKSASQRKLTTDGIDFNQLNHLAEGLEELTLIETN
jgi:segregation and condensation protein A